MNNLPIWWKAEKPTNAGVYFMNLGDVVTENSLKLIVLKENSEGEIVDEYGDKIICYPDSCKYSSVDIDLMN
jgi:hypothetical protein